MKKTLVTGNLGYIGSVLTPMLAERGYQVIGYDANLYGRECLLYDPPEHGLTQITKDIRDASPMDFEGVDYVIHLSALSNDPLGELRPAATEEINLSGAQHLATVAKQAGVKRFIYASSQSMYGISETGGELDEDKSAKNPITSYARTKWQMEQWLMERMNDDTFIVTALRPSTVFGASPKLRCDIVFNNLVACGYTTGRIEIKSDGSPWRPVVHVKDVCSAFIAGVEAPPGLVAGQAFNVGVPEGNYTVRDLGEAAQRCVPGADLVFTGEHGADSRTYRVSFAKILKVLRDYYQPEWDLVRGGRELVELFDRVNFNQEDFRGPRCVRLAQLRRLMQENKLTEDLRWVGN
ncbi:MAG TPA: NAD(P)-dependent oxidoreductase [Nitrospirae bacterium]|nr:NAD(P)-dependent oxidoreductase [Nitrospirota bacterium]